MTRTDMLTVSLALLLSLARPAGADTVYLLGKIGTLPVVASLDGNRGKVGGWYSYRSNGRQIRLEGLVDRNGDVRLQESVDGKKTGSFTGRVVDRRWTGTWQRPTAGDPLPFVLEESHDLLEDFAADYACSARESRPQYAYTYKWQLTLKAANGVVHRLDSEQGAYGDDEQVCSLDLTQLKRIPSKAGILFRSKGSHSGAADTCTVRVLASDQTVWVVFGDPSQAGNQCRADAEETFCSPRAFWNDVVIDRQSKKCRGVY